MAPEASSPTSSDSPVATDVSDSDSDGSYDATGGPSLDRALSHLRDLWDTVATPMAAPTTSSATVAALLTKAAAYENDAYDMARAQRWAAGFEFPPEMHTAHLAELQALGLNFEQYAKVKQDALRPNMISPARFVAAVAPYRHLIPPDDYERGLALANGIPVLTGPSFVERTQPSPFRRKYRDGRAAIHRLTHKQYSDGTLLAFPTDSLPSIPHSAPFHFNDVNWAPKKDTDSGRLIVDHSYSTVGSHLNGNSPAEKELLRAMLDAEFGRIELDNLDTLALMVLEAVDVFGWDDTVLFTKDVRKAFNQLFFLPSFVRLFAVALLGGLTVFHLVGNFGWTGLPNAWGVISRILLRIATSRIQPLAPTQTTPLIIYVDDFCGATGRHIYPAVSSAINTTITDTIGPFGLADDKDRQGTENFVMLGWSFDLPTRTVSLAERNLLKTITSALKVDTRRRSVSRLQPLQSLASRLSRASALSPVMRTFTVSIYADIAGYRGDKKKKRCLRGETRADITLWRAFLVLMGTQRARFCRHLESFRPHPPATVRIAFDGSLFGLGVVVWHRPSATDDFTLLAFASIFPIPFHLDGKDASYQNTTELAAATSGILIALLLGHRAFSFELLGDSVTVLQWADQGRVRSNVARRMAVGFALASATADAIVHDTTFVSSADNALCDDLSRGVLEHHAAHLDQRKYLRIGHGHPVLLYLAACDPTVPCDSFDLHATHSSRLCGLLHQLSHPLSPSPLSHASP